MHNCIGKHLQRSHSRSCPDFKPILLHFKKHQPHTMLLILHQRIPTRIGHNLKLFPHFIDNLPRHSIRRILINIVIKLGDLIQFLQIFGQSVMGDRSSLVVEDFWDIEFLGFHFRIDIVDNTGNSTKYMIFFLWFLIVFMIIQCEYFPLKITDEFA